MTCIPYHVRSDDGTHLSLAAVSDTETGATTYAESFSGPDRMVRMENHADGLWGIYTGTSTGLHSDPWQNVVPETEFQHFVYDLSRGVSTGDARPSKQYDLSGAVEAIRECQWRDSVIRVAGELLSRVIRRHPFPNGNHRTSLALTATYLATVLDSTPRNVLHPETVPEWLLNQFIGASKRWVTTARRKNVFRYAEKFGASAVVRKNGVVIPLSYVLDHDPVNHHESVCQSLIRLWFDEERFDSSVSDDGFRAFRDRVASSNWDGEAVGRQFAGLRD